VLKETALLRQDLHDGLEPCGPRARQLAELDESFDGMFRVELTHAVMRLEGQLSARLEPALLQALDALAPDSTAADVQPMFAPDGCVGAFLRDGERLTLTLLELEWSPLMGLLQAVLTNLEHNAEHNAEQDAHASSDEAGQRAHPQAHADTRQGEVS
jgi:hypothetical protein